MTFCPIKMSSFIIACTNESREYVVAGSNPLLPQRDFRMSLCSLPVIPVWDRVGIQMRSGGGGIPAPARRALNPSRSRARAKAYEQPTGLFVSRLSTSSVRIPPCRKRPPKRERPRSRGLDSLAEEEGFEPSLPGIPVKQFSRLPHSTTLPPLRGYGVSHTADGQCDMLSVLVRSNKKTSSMPHGDTIRTQEKGTPWSSTQSKSRCQSTLSKR